MVMNPETRAVGVWSWVHGSWCRQTGMHVTWHPVVRRWGGMRWIAVARDPKFPPSRVKQPTAVECWAECQTKALVCCCREVGMASDIWAIC